MKKESALSGGIKEQTSTALEYIEPSVKGHDRQYIKKMFN